MTVVFSAPTGAYLYRAQLQALLEAPEVLVRGLKTRELLNVITEIQFPRARIQIVPGRRLNPWLALSESLWLLAGRNDTSALLPYNKRILEFSDDGDTLYGAYGKRLMPQVPAAVERLRKDNHDRRAVLSIWREKDLTADVKDPPCNDLVMFKLRGEHLHMTVINRSNDLHWGLHAVNLIQFSILQEYMAYLLSFNVGTQVHLSNSLHIYMEGAGAQITANMIRAKDEEITYLLPDDLLFPAEPIRNISQQCSYVLDEIRTEEDKKLRGEFLILEDISV